MTEGWVVRRLGEVCAPTRSANPQGSPSTEFTYVDVSSVSNRTFRIEETQRLLGSSAPSRARRLIAADDVLFATIRPTLQRIAVVPPELDGAVCSTGYIVLRARRDLLHPRYLFHWLFSKPFSEAMAALQKGASYPAVTDVEVRSQTIPVPPLAEQERIVRILDESLDGIASISANYRRCAEGAGEAFSTHRDELFAIGRGVWQQEDLGEVAQLVRGPFGGSLKKSSFVETGFAVYEQQHAIQDQFSRFRYFVEAGKFAEMRRFEVLAGDVLMSCSGTIGRVAAVPEGAPEGIINQALLKIRPSPLVVPGFLVHWMRSLDFQQQVAGHSSGAAMQNITSVAILKKLPAPVPDRRTQNRIIDELARLQVASSELQRAYQRQEDMAGSLRASLLDQAFSGRL